MDSSLFDGSELQVVLVNQCNLFVADQYVNTNFFSISPVGSQINYRVSDDSTRTLSLVGETNLAPEGITLQNGTPCLLITSRSQLQKFTGDLQPYHTAKLCVQSKRDEVFVRDAQKLLKPLDFDNVLVYNYAAELRNKRNNRLVVGIFVYGFITLITLICVANVFNTISTGMALRRREFAMLKSIGMTPKSINRMIWYESFFYGFKALLYGLPASFLLMLTLSRIILSSFVYALQIPWKEVGIAIISVFLLILLIMLRSASAMKKETIVDALKQENL